jgi:TPP-dependent pyruvate/acetoin dehydrogenase alpha subunit
MTENKAPMPNLIAAEAPPRPAQTVNPTAERQREFYYFLQLNRQLETRLERLFRQGKIVGGLYSSLGQEAISVGAASALEPQDWLAPMIRNIGALLVKGVPPRDIFTQHMGRATSPTHGKDGTNHFADLKHRHIVAPNSMLGDLIPVMTGVAMAARYLGQKIVALTFIGDGGSSTGAFHEGMNLAASQRAPLVVILENNQWAYSTPASRQVPVRDLAQRAAAYGIRSSIVDGNDVLAVLRAANEAVSECRAGRGPWLIEAKTMRMKGHAQHDPAEYVPKEMFDYWRARDPIDRYARYLGERSLMDKKQRAEIDARVERELDVEQNFAEESPFPDAQSAAQGVYCEGCHTIEADWQRPIAEVTPPATTTQAVWKITDFGALAEKPAAAPPRPHAPNVPRAKPPHIQPAKPAQAPRKHPHLGPRPQQPPRNVPAPVVPLELAEEEYTPVTPTGEAPIRVPFGRGPKDRAFVKDQPPPQAPRHAKPHRHDTRKPSNNKRKR